MTRQNFEIGVQRLYYIAWAVLATVFTIVAIIEGLSYDRKPVEYLPYIGLILAAIFGPAVLQIAARWVYRGFIPKTQ